jgi:hypothetical protein
MAGFAAIDTDGHVLERQSDIRKYLESPWNKRPTPLWTGDQPWDNDMMDSFEMARQWKGHSAAGEVDRWHKIMDEHEIATAICFPTGSGNIAKNQEVPYQIAVVREQPAFCPRVQCPLRSAVLRRLFTDAFTGSRGGRAKPRSHRVAAERLGDFADRSAARSWGHLYDPIYAETERLGTVLGIHGARAGHIRFGDFLRSSFLCVPGWASCCNLPAWSARVSPCISRN